MAVPPVTPKIKPRAVALGVPSARPAIPAEAIQAILMETPIRSRASVEIETMTRGTPKVKVRIDDDDPTTAQDEALRLYWGTVGALKARANHAGKEEDDNHEMEV